MTGPATRARLRIPAGRPGAALLSPKAASPAGSGQSVERACAGGKALAALHNSGEIGG